GDYSTASIFLPCTGYGYGTSLYHTGSYGYGYFWSSVPLSDINYYAWCLYFDPGHCYRSEYDNRAYGRSVRPLQGFTK
ncbi:MAG: hypothetical protein IJC66_06365, partial [Kiritimatiellae bacterium]|nr:hypothetical protein [Kiritimatiellia bacterium]